MRAETHLMRAGGALWSPDAFEIDCRPSSTIERLYRAGATAFGGRQRRRGYTRRIQAEAHIADDGLPIPLALHVRFQRQALRGVFLIDIVETAGTGERAGGDVVIVAAD